MCCINWCNGVNNELSLGVEALLLNVLLDAREDVLTLGDVDPCIEIGVADPDTLGLGVVWADRFPIVLML